MHKQLEELFGNQVKKYKNKKVKMPLYLMDGRDFFDVVICDTEFVLVVFWNVGRFNVSSFKKQVVQYAKAFDKPVVYGFKTLTTFQRKALIENGLSFVSENGQVFIPFLGCAFSKCISNEIDKERSHFAPSTQLLFLLMLYGDDHMQINKNMAAEMLHLTPMSITRAVRQCKQIGLIEETKIGTESRISRKLSKSETFELAKEYLMNPIQKCVYVSQKELKSRLTVAGEYALSIRSELSYPLYEEYAAEKRFLTEENLSNYNPDLEIHTKLSKIQIWKYNPELFSEKHSADPVSLLCSFSDNQDERIHMCLRDIEKEIKGWQIKMRH